MFQVIIKNNSAEVPVNTLWIFDLDHTLVAPKNGKFAKDENDYKFLRTVVTDDYVDIMIYSNQLKPHAGFLEKAQKICEKIAGDCPNANIYFFAAFEKDHFRKPCTKGLTDNFDMSRYIFKIFVGDAAGRPNDFSDTDYKFATNLGAYFLVPEAYDSYISRTGTVNRFSNHSAIKRHVRRSERKCQEQIDSAVCYIDFSKFERCDLIERYKKILGPLTNKKIIMCGRQGSGKSTFVKVAEQLGISSYEYRAGYRIYNGSIMDGTFPDNASRSKYRDAVIINFITILLSGLLQDVA